MATRQISGLPVKSSFLTTDVLPVDDSSDLTWQVSGQQVINLVNSGGGSGSFSSIDLTNTTNQIVMGTTHTTTIDSVAPSASRVYTIQDAGGSADILTSTYSANNIALNTTTANTVALGFGSTLTIDSSGNVAMPVGVGTSIQGQQSQLADYIQIGQDTAPTTTEIAGAINVGVRNTTGQISIGTAGVRTIGLGFVGSTTLLSSTVLMGGGAFTINTCNNGSIGISNSGAGTYAVNIGTSGTTTTVVGIVSINGSGSANTNIGSGSYSGTVNIGNGSGTTNIATGNSSTAVNIGNTSTPSLTVINGKYRLSTTDVTGGSQTLATGGRYWSDSSSLTTFTLPASPTQGDRFEIYGIGSGGWKVAQNASQFINFGTATTTAGTGGSLASNNQYDSVVIIAYSTTNFVAYPLIGNITVT
jgi:hypothetical protein